MCIRDRAHFLPLLLGDADLAGLAALGGPHNAARLHLVDQAGGAGIAQLKAALQEGDRGVPGLQHGVDGGQQHFVFLVLAGTRSAGLPALFAFALDLLHHDLVVVMPHVLPLDVGHDGRCV